MTDVTGTQAPLFQVKRYACLLGVAWTLTVFGLLTLELTSKRGETLETARTTARAAFEKDVLYRRWNAMHGGVYVPLTESTPANPYLDVPEREITTPSGQVLTKVNPAYMTRQVHELGRKKSGTRGHLTSLNPIRPENEADPWETMALQDFERGETEISSVETMEGISYMRLMRPLITEESCLKCHADQGYQEGDIRGGISASIPMAPLWAITRPQIAILTVAHTILWALGLLGIRSGPHCLDTESSLLSGPSMGLCRGFFFGV